MSGDYPTEDELKVIETWNGDWNEWFAFIKGVWWRPDWGWSEGRGLDELLNEKMVTTYKISTGGWSGNEDVISAMEKNFAWFMFWVQSRRGGHYIFEVPDAIAGASFVAQEVVRDS